MVQALGPKLVHAQDDRGFLARVYKDSDGGAHKYATFVPHAYNPNKSWPVILFLHGNGQRGDDGLKPLNLGLGAAIKRQERTFPFIVVFPQCSSEGSWNASGPDSGRAMAMLAEVEKEFSVDPDRIYLTGVSMGGHGVWQIAGQHPDRFAALVPVCGAGNPIQVAKISHIPVWCFHGDADKVVNVSGSRSMIDALKAVGGHGKLTEYRGVGHNCWDRVYSTRELYTWVLEQKRKPKNER